MGCRGRVPRRGGARSPPLGPAGEEGAAAGPGLLKPRSLLSACRAARTGGPPAIRTGSPRGLPAMPPAPPLQPQAPPRAGDFGACGSQNLASPSELPGSKIPESVRAFRCPRLLLEARPARVRALRPGPLPKSQAASLQSRIPYFGMLSS